MAAESSALEGSQWHARWVSLWESQSQGRCIRHAGGSRLVCFDDMNDDRIPCATNTTTCKEKREINILLLLPYIAYSLRIRIATGT